MFGTAFDSVPALTQLRKFLQWPRLAQIKNAVATIRKLMGMPGTLSLPGRAIGASQRAMRAIFSPLSHVDSIARRATKNNGAISIGNS